MFDTEGARQKFELTNKIVQVKFYVQIDSSKIWFHKECRAFQSKYWKKNNYDYKTHTFLYVFLQLLGRPDDEFSKFSREKCKCYMKKWKAL